MSPSMIDGLLTDLKSLPDSYILVLCCMGIAGIVVSIFLAAILSSLKRKNRSLQLTVSLLKERLELQNQHALDKQELLEKAATDMRLQFKDLAHSIFDEKSRILSDQNSEKLNLLLHPFKEQIQNFRDRIDTIFLEDTKERTSLKQEILHLRDLNNRINDEARNLTRAISGNKQVQGTWGEVILEKILEQSGLRKGHEYETQSGFRDQENRLFKPDVIVHLPDDKDIVIDSKVSLADWTRYVAAEDKEEQSAALQDHLSALRNHIKMLNSKDYSSLRGLRSLDFVLMFIPIDAAFMTAIQGDEKLIAEMYSRKIVIVSPTTLLATLKTVEHIWQLERQNRNALEIANRAALLYDKLRGFLEDMEKLGKQLDTCRDSYDRAMNKISRGRGNLVAQASMFPELGVQIKKEISRDLVDKSPEEKSLKN